MRKLAFTVGLAFALLLLLSACGSGDSGPTPTNVLTPIPGNYVPLVITDKIVVGDNRFVVGVIKSDDSSQVVGASLHFRFFKVNADNTGTLRFEQDADTIVSEKSYVDTHPDGTHEVHK